MANILQKVDDKIDDVLEKNTPTGKAAKLNNLWLGTCAATVAAGLYTGIVDWNPIVRIGAHLGGAFAIPAGGAFVSSLAMHGIEGIVNLGINSYNKKHPGNPKDQFKIDPKVKELFGLLASAAVGITYSWATLQTEQAQYDISQIPQYGQYAADVLGSAAGIIAFHELDFKDTTVSFFNKVRALSKTVIKPINALEDKLKGKDKEKNNNEQKSSSLQVEEINFDSEMSKVKDEDIPVWNIALYDKAHTTITHENNTHPEHLNKTDELTR